MTGLGTELDPYVIYNATDLQNVNNDLDAWYILNNDIDLQGFNFTPIGANTTSGFIGHFDGKGYKISNLNISGGNDILGLFAHTRAQNLTGLSIDIKNIVLENFTLAGGQFMGSLIGATYIYGTDITLKIENITVNTVIINGSSNIQGHMGGLIGFVSVVGKNNKNSKIIIKHCETTNVIINNNESTCDCSSGLVFGSIVDPDPGGNITITCCKGVSGALTDTGGDFIGGFCGIIAFESNITITDCFANATINGKLYEGGFIGKVRGYGAGVCSIMRCKSNGGIASDKQNAIGGGFIGNAEAYGNSQVVIQNCYANTSVNNSNTNTYAGGFIAIGYHDTTAVLKIENSYALGALTATNRGGFIEESGGATITSCYWDIDTTGVATSDGGTGKNDTEMKMQSTFVNWDFSNTWIINEGNDYPKLLDKCVKLIKRVMSFNQFQRKIIRY